MWYVNMSLLNNNSVSRKYTTQKPCTHTHTPAIYEMTATFPMKSKNFQINQFHLVVIRSSRVIPAILVGYLSSHWCCFFFSLSCWYGLFYAVHLYTLRFVSWSIEWGKWMTNWTIVCVVCVHLCICMEFSCT